MKFKALKSFISGVGTFNTGEEYDVKLDKPTQKMWIEHGLIEKVEAKKDQETAQEPTQETAPETQPTTQEAAPNEEVKPVDSNENQ